MFVQAICASLFELLCDRKLLSYIYIYICRSCNYICIYIYIYNCNCDKFTWTCVVGLMILSSLRSSHLRSWTCTTWLDRTWYNDQLRSINGERYQRVESREDSRNYDSGDQLFSDCYCIAPDERVLVNTLIWSSHQTFLNLLLQENHNFIIWSSFRNFLILDKCF